MKKGAESDDHYNFEWVKHMTNIDDQGDFTEEQWAATYLPVNNPNAADESTVFDTVGEDMQWISKQINDNKTNHIWTLISGDYDSMHIVSGVHRVNRMGYYFTEKPHDGSHIEIKVGDISDSVSLEQAYEAFERIKEESDEYEDPSELPDDADENETVIEIAEELDVDPGTLILAIDFHHGDFDAYGKRLAAEQLAEEHNPSGNVSVKRPKI